MHLGHQVAYGFYELMWTHACCSVSTKGEFVNKLAKLTLNVLCRISDMLSTEEKLTLVRSFILCHYNFLAYCLKFCSVTDKKERENTRKGITFCMLYGRFNSTYKDLQVREKSGLALLYVNRLCNIMCEIFKTINGMAPDLGKLVTVKEISD